MTEEEIIQRINHFNDLAERTKKDCLRNDYKKKVKFYERMLKDGLQNIENG